MLIKERILQFISKLIFKILNSETYDTLKPAENSKSYVLKNLKFIGSNYTIPNSFTIKNPQYISIGNNFFSLYNLRLEAWDEFRQEIFSPKIIIGNNVAFNTDVHIGCIDKIVIHDNVLIASRVYISDHSHGDTSPIDPNQPVGYRNLKSKGPVIIEENVWIGEGVCILPGVTIGKNSIVGANAVVTKSFPENSVLAGIPAKVIKTLIHK